MAAAALLSEGWASRSERDETSLTAGHSPAQTERGAMRRKQRTEGGTAGGRQKLRGRSQGRSGTRRPCERRRPVSVMTTSCSDLRWRAVVAGFSLSCAVWRKIEAEGKIA